MTVPLQLGCLYKRLESRGIPRAYLKKVVLPEWFEDSAAETQVGFAQTAAIISRHIGLDLKSLLDESAFPVFRDAVCKFKKPSNHEDGDLELARSIATRAAQIALAATAVTFTGLPTAREIRNEILASGAKWVDFESLLDFAWSHGIPVLHVSHFPPNAKKMHGMVVSENSNPAIVLCKKSSHAAWLLFILAHEIGHIASGHVAGTSSLVDCKVDKASQDTEEIEANTFAIEALTGHKEYKCVASGGWPNSEQLALEAQRIGLAKQVDPGHVILNYAHSMEFFPIANAALARIEGADPNKLLLNRMSQQLDWSMIPSESSEFLMKVCRMPKDAVS